MQRELNKIWIELIMLEETSNNVVGNLVRGVDSPIRPWVLGVVGLEDLEEMPCVVIRTGLPLSNHPLGGLTARECRVFPRSDVVNCTVQDGALLSSSAEATAKNTAERTYLAFAGDALGRDMGVTTAIAHYTTDALHGGELSEQNCLSFVEVVFPHCVELTGGFCQA